MTATLAPPRPDHGLSLTSLVSLLQPGLAAGNPSKAGAADQALERAAWTALEDGRSGEAIELLRRWHELDPTNAVPGIRIAVALAVDGQTREAEETLRAVLARHPDCGDAWGVLGFLLARQDDRVGDALTAIDKALAITPNDQLARAVRVMLRSDAGDLEGVIEDCAALSPDSPYFAASRLEWAAALGRLGQYGAGLRKLHELDGPALGEPEAAELRTWLLDEFFAERRDPHWGPRLPGKPKGLNPPVKLRGDGPLVSQMILDDRE